MFDAEENIMVPENIDDYIIKGIALGVKKKKSNKIKLVANAAAISILTLFTVSVRTSPTFAAYMSKVPGLEYLVRYINYDKGLQGAIENNFIQHLNSSVTKEGIKFTIKDVIIDNSQAIIFYSIENQIDNRDIQLAKIDIANERYEDLRLNTSWASSRPYESSGNNKVEDKIEVNFLEGTVPPDKLLLNIKLRDEGLIDHENYAESVKKSMLDSSWNFELTVDKEKIKTMEHTYVLYQEVDIEGQKINFKQVVVSPTRIAVEVEYNPNNTKKILGYDDIILIDEKGETWGTIMNGAVSKRVDENTEILYFQSSYFKNPEHLYIKFSDVRALDKDKLDVVVDLENSKLLKAPDERLTLKAVQKTEKEIDIIFSMKPDKIFNDKIGYFIFNHTLKDANGNTSYETSVETWRDGLKEEDKIPMINFVIKNNPKIQGPISIELSNYPTRISGDFEVKIK